MLTYSVILLSLIVFLPTVGAIALLTVPGRFERLIKWMSLAVTLVVFALTLWLAIPSPDNVQRAVGGPNPSRFVVGAAEMQQAFSIPWIRSFDINYALGVDGISLPLVLLTSLLSVVAMGASWPITKQVKGYCVLFLLLETGLLGVFLALDFFLFYVFWEVTLLPMFFLIGIWGGPRREYAAIKFFLFTLVGSVLMLVALLALYFSSDLGRLNDQQRAEALVSREVQTELWAGGGPVHTFNLTALATMGQMKDSPFDAELFAGRSIQWWAFLLLLIGFLVKVPAVPMHTWLPDAHVEAPTPISMILAGVLLKMGGYGILRICYPICPDAAYQLAWLVCTLGVVSMVYGAFAALAQRDFKRLVAYSSVSHMGYVVLGLGVWTIAAGTGFNGDFWKFGMNGALFQMIAHGITSAGMFFLVGMIYERVHHRDLDRMGGLFGKMPVHGGIAVVIFFAGMGLPGLCGFVGEIFVVLSVWNYSQVLAIVAASVVILTAAYILWTVQRVYLGAEYKGPDSEAVVPITKRELAIAAPLVFLAILLGVYPRAVLDYSSPSVNKTVDDLAVWMRDVKQPTLEKEIPLGDAPLGGTPRARRWAWLAEQAESPPDPTTPLVPRSVPPDESAGGTSRAERWAWAVDSAQSSPDPTTPLVPRGVPPGARATPVVYLQGDDQP